MEVSLGTISLIRPSGEPWPTENVKWMLTNAQMLDFEKKHNRRHSFSIYNVVCGGE